MLEGAIELCHRYVGVFGGGVEQNLGVVREKSTVSDWMTEWVSNMYMS